MSAYGYERKFQPPLGDFRFRALSRHLRACLNPPRKPPESRTALSGTQGRRPGPFCALSPRQARNGARKGPAGCTIKGNISSSGERIYHITGGQYYDRTKINTAKGERWFCSEAEAVSRPYGLPARLRA